jgi:chromosomal replication initiation ATPase DnaA
VLPHARLTSRFSYGPEIACQPEAAQEKLNVIAEALAALMASRAIEDHTLEVAVTRLRDAVGLDVRH